MTLNPAMTKRWALCVVLLAVLVAVPGVVRAGDAPSSRTSQPAQTEKAHPGATPLCQGADCSMPACPADDGKAGLAIRAIDSQTYEVVHTRTDREPYCEFARGGRVVPAFKNGACVGLKLFSIQPGSAYARMGLQNGDTVVSLNGMPLTLPDETLAAYRTVVRESRVVADINRNGERIQLTYLVKQAPPQ